MFYAMCLIGGIIGGFLFGLWFSDWYDRHYNEERIGYEEAMKKYFNK